jgi:hypothetical protein
VRRALPHLSALVCGVAAALVVGCAGQSNLVPANDAQTLKDQLAQVQQAVKAGNCAAAASALAQAKQTAQALPASVDRRLRQRINRGIKALEDTAPNDCRAAAPATVTTTQTDTTPTDTTPTQTDTTPTDTTPTTPTDTTPTDTTPATTTPSDTTPVPPTDTSTTPPADSGGAGAPTP